MTTVESKGILLELRTFLKELIAYGNDTSRIQSLKKDEKEYAIKLRKKLVYKVGSLKGDIILLTGIEQVPIIYRGREYPTDIWLVGLRPKINWRTSAALHYCIDATRQAVGRIKSDIRQGYRDKEGNPIKEPPELSKKPAEVIGELPIQLFDKMRFHPRIIKASKSLFISGHYAEAIFAACKAINNFTKRKAGQSLDGKDLMAKVFNEDKPIIKLNKLITRSERDEQEGFRFLYMGAMVGIRNPKAHDDIRQIDPYKALEYLAFASLLMRRVTEGKLEPKGA